MKEQSKKNTMNKPSRINESRKGKVSASRSTFSSVKGRILANKKNGTGPR